MAGPYSYGINIEGIGSGSGAANADGIVWYTGRTLTSAQKAASTFEWVGDQGSNAGLILGDSQTIDTSIDPFTSDVRGASQTFELSYSDAAAQLLVFQAVETTVSVATAITASSTALVLTGTGSTGLTGVVWIYDEAILLGTESPSGTYDITGNRGYYSTSAAPAGVGASVYLKVPRHVGRRVRFIEFDHSDDSETVVATGFLDESVQTSSDGTRLQIPIREIWSLIAGARVNRGAPDLTRYTTAMARYFPDENQIKFEGRIEHEWSPKRVAKTGDTAHIQAYQLGPSLVYGDFNASALGGIGATQFLEDGATSVFVGGTPEKMIKGPTQNFEEYGIKEQIYEVFAIVRRLGDTYQPTRDLTYVYHPVAIAMALLTSTSGAAVDTSSTKWDCLGRAWGLGMPLDWFDTTDISNKIAASAGQQVDQMILGWDGEEVDVWDTVKRLLVAYGWFVASTGEGKITFAEMRPADVEDINNATAVVALPTHLEWLPSRSETVDIITGRVGTSPWHKGIPVEAVARDYDSGEPSDSLRAAIFAQRSTVEYDLQFYTNVDDVLQTLISEIINRHLAMPRLRIRVAAGSYTLGSYVKLTSPDIVKLPERNGWFVDKDGNMTGTTTDVTSFTGLIIGRRLEIRTQTYLLTLLLTQYRTNQYARWIAPSGEVQSYSAGGPTVTLVTGAFVADQDSHFTQGDKVEVFKPDGTHRSGSPGSPDVVTINSISTNVLTLSAAFSTGAQAGDIIELARLNDSTGYPYAGNATGPFASDRGWAYIAEADGTLGADNVDADIYDSRRN